MRFLSFIILVVLLSCVACSKDNGHNESILYGTWVKGKNYGDTLSFLRKNDINLLVYENSFNVSYPGQVQTEYIFNDNKLTLISSSSLGPIKQDIKSFTWTRYGKEFRVIGTQLYPFMSSLTVFTYTKIN